MFDLVITRARRAAGYVLPLRTAQELPAQYRQGERLYN